MSNGKVLNFVAVGVVIGLALSMTDKKTREKTISKTKNIRDNISHYNNNREELYDKLKTKSEDWQVTFKKLQDDATFVLEKVNELRELSDPLQSLIADSKKSLKETKQAINQTKEDLSEAVSKNPEK